MKKLFALFLLSLLVIQESIVTARSIQHHELYNSYWEVIPDSNEVLAGPEIRHFTLNETSFSIYTRNGKLGGDYVLCYVASDSTDVFDRSKTDSWTSGRWLITRKEKGVAHSARISMTENGLLIIQDTRHTSRYKRVTKEYVQKLENSTPKGNIMQLLSQYNWMAQNPDILCMVNDSPGKEDSWKKAFLSPNIKRATTLRICGPINGLDIATLNFMLSNNDFSNFKVLDLSRAWIVSDTVPSLWYSEEWYHNDFSHLSGKRYRGRVEDFPFNEYITKSADSIEWVLDEEGYSVEYKADEQYLFLITTQENTVKHYTFHDLPNIEKILLPQNCKTLQTNAFVNCLALQEVTLLSRVQLIEPSAFHFCPQLRAIHLIDNPHKEVLEGRQKQEKTSFTEPYNADLQFDYQETGNTVIPNGAADSVQISKLYQDYKEELRKLFLTINRLEYEIQREWTSEGIQEKKQGKTREEQRRFNLLREIILGQRNNLMPSDFVIEWSHVIPTASLLQLIALMDDDNAHRYARSSASTTLINSTRPDPIDWEDWNDTLNTTDILVTEPNTLSTQLDLNQLQSTQRLRISGPLGLEDMQWLAENGKRLRLLDLSQASLSSLPHQPFKEMRLTHLALPDSLSRIDKTTFAGCRQLRTVRLPSSLRVIGSYTFAYTDLEHIVIPEGVERIDEMAFERCKLLHHIQLPQSLQKIGYKAFANCSNLHYLHIPANTTSIGINCVAFCPKIQVTVAPENKYFKVIDNQIVGNTPETRHELHQYRDK